MDKTITGLVHITIHRSEKMNRLNTACLSEIRTDIQKPNYAQAAITSGIVHFGVGNFHRAHQAVYCDGLLNEGETSWGIIGVSMRSPNMRDKLAPQDYLYTQATLGQTTTDYRVIGSIQKILVAPENPQTIIDVVANNQTQLVTTTITEKGYCLSNGKIDLDHPDFTKEIESLKQPKTIYGYLAAAFVKRFAAQGMPLTILCCDNIHAGGEHLRNGVQMLLEHHSPETLIWIKKNVAFSSSMVDRVTPSTSEELIEDVAQQLGLSDAAPVAAEPFTQWVIQDNFAGERPPFDRVGALFVEDIEPYESVKLRFLNAGHSMLATIGYLAGDTFVHEALQRPALAQFTEQALKLNVLPITQVPNDISGEVYIDEVLERFRNGNLPYACLQVGTDSSQKIQQRWMPSIDDALADGKDASYLAFTLAAWVNFVSKALENDDLNDPLRGELSEALARNKSEGSESNVQGFLTLAGSERFAFSNNDQFMTMVVNFHQIINEVGVEQALTKKN